MADRLPAVTPGVWRLLAAIPMGLLLGAFSAFGDGLRGDTPLHVVVALANAAGPWFVVAFAAGALQSRPLTGAGAGLLTLVLAVGAYYAGIYAGGHTVAELGRALAAWSAVAVAVGPVLGACGAAWSTVGQPRRAQAVGVLAGALLAEAVFRLVQHQFWSGIDLAATDAQVAVVDAVLALVAPLVLLRERRTAAYALAVLLGAVGALAIWGVTELARGAVA